MKSRISFWKHSRIFFAHPLSLWSTCRFSKAFKRRSLDRPSEITKSAWPLLFNTIPAHNETSWQGKFAIIVSHSLAVARGKRTRLHNVIRNESKLSQTFTWNLSSFSFVRELDYRSKYETREKGKWKLFRIIKALFDDILTPFSISETRQNSFSTPSQPQALTKNKCFIIRV